MINLALSGLETAINAFLKLDPETLTRLEKLSGKIIKVDISDWNFCFYIEPSAQGMHLYTQISAQPDTIIRGKLGSLLRVGKAQGENKALFDNAIEISGDMDTGSAIREIMQKIDIDWEEHLSRITGDEVAHTIGEQTRKTIQAGKDAADSVKFNIKEFIFAEAKFFPTKVEVEQFYQDISQLRDDVDRLEARIKRLTNQAKQ